MGSPVCVSTAVDADHLQPQAGARVPGSSRAWLSALARGPSSRCFPKSHTRLTAAGSWWCSSLVSGCMRGQALASTRIISSSLGSPAQYSESLFRPVQTSLHHGHAQNLSFSTLVVCTNNRHSFAMLQASVQISLASDSCSTTFRSPQNV